MTTAWLITLVVLLLASALLSAAESACGSVATSNLRAMQEEGFSGAAELLQLRAQAPRSATSVLLLNLLLDTGAVGLVVVWASVRWGAGGGFLALALAALVTFLGAEVLPRMLGARRPVRLALVSAPVLLVLVRTLRPFMAPLSGLESFLERQDSLDGSTRGQRELRAITALGREAGVVGEEEHDLVERAFRLDERTAWDVMTPRVEIFAWSDSLTLAEIVPELGQVPYSRVPVYHETIDEITGIMYVREAYRAFAAGRGDLPLARLAREPLFVPGSLPLTQLLRYFQGRRIHMGIVADEFGGTDGLVTMEDVLEELVGDIRDETDLEEPSVHRVSRSEVIAEGAAELREINYAINISLPHLEHRSLNGWVLEELGHVPQAGEVVEHTDALVEVMEASETQVLKARVRRRSPVLGAEAS
ncbi:MAG: hemolysin family protein [Gemmatimonadota bacterium]